MSNVLFISYFVLHFSLLSCPQGQAATSPRGFGKSPISSAAPSPRWSSVSVSTSPSRKASAQGPLHSGAPSQEMSPGSPPHLPQAAMSPRAKSQARPLPAKPLPPSKISKEKTDDSSSSSSSDDEHNVNGKQTRAAAKNSASATPQKKNSASATRGGVRSEEQKSTRSPPRSGRSTLTEPVSLPTIGSETSTRKSSVNSRRSSAIELDPVLEHQPFSPTNDVDCPSPNVGDKKEQAQQYQSNFSDSQNSDSQTSAQM